VIPWRRDSGGVRVAGFLGEAHDKLDYCCAPPRPAGPGQRQLGKAAGQPCSGASAPSPGTSHRPIWKGPSGKRTGCIETSETPSVRCGGRDVRPRTGSFHQAILTPPRRRFSHPVIWRSHRPRAPSDDAGPGMARMSTPRRVRSRSQPRVNHGAVLCPEKGLPAACRKALNHCPV